MEVEAQGQLIREFMLAVAPQVTAYSLETGAGMIENAALTLECSMQLAARYNELYETLTTASQDPAAADQPETRAPTASVQPTQARIPIKKSAVSDLPGSKEQRRSSPLSPSWQPPDPYY